MQYLLTFSLVILAVQHCVAPPVTKTKDAESDKENEIESEEDMKNVMEYHRYLDEVVQALESDPEFRAKLEKAEETDIRSGKIADELDFVNHNVRTKLDELKRMELERLKHLATREYEIENGLDPDHRSISEHLDNSNPHTFEVIDLKKLIAKTTQDLAEADRKRRESFKEYEMQKKFEQHENMKAMNEEEQKKYEEQLKTMEAKHKKHQPLHHPGSKQQLEEVWEKQDHMDSQDFEPRTFFYLHDLDGNGVWDQNEVKSLFLKELDKMYAEGAPEDDLRERAEEMERMREHVFNEADLNKDGLISYKEFLEQTNKPEFQKDEGWQPLDEQQIYSQQEYEAFERRRREEIERLIAKGILPPHHGNYVPGHPQQFPPQHGNIPVEHGIPHQDFVPPMGARVPPNQQQQQLNYPNQVPQQQHYQGQVPPQQQQQQFQGQLPPQHVQQQQQQQQFQAQPPQQGYPVQGQLPPRPQEQVPQQQHYQQGPPQQQQQLGQIPVHQVPQVQQGQVPKVAQQQPPVGHAQQKTPEAPTHQQNTQNEVNAQGNAPIQQQNIQTQNNQTPQHVERIQLPVQQAAGAISGQAHAAAASSKVTQV